MRAFSAINCFTVLCVTAVVKQSASFDPYVSSSGSLTPYSGTQLSQTSVSGQTAPSATDILAAMTPQQMQSMTPEQRLKLQAMLQQQQQQQLEEARRLQQQLLQMQQKEQQQQQQQQPTQTQQRPTADNTGGYLSGFTGSPNQQQSVQQQANPQQLVSYEQVIPQISMPLKPQPEQQQQQQQQQQTQETSFVLSGANAAQTSGGLRVQSTSSTKDSPDMLSSFVSSSPTSSSSSSPTLSLPAVPPASDPTSSIPGSSGGSTAFDTSQDLIPASQASPQTQPSSGVTPMAMAQLLQQRQQQEQQAAAAASSQSQAREQFLRQLQQQRTSGQQTTTREQLVRALSQQHQQQPAAPTTQPQLAVTRDQVLQTIQHHRATSQQPLTREHLVKMLLQQQQLKQQQLKQQQLQQQRQQQQPTSQRFGPGDLLGQVRRVSPNQTPRQYQQQSAADATRAALQRSQRPLPTDLLAQLAKNQRMSAANAGVADSAAGAMTCPKLTPGAACTGSYHHCNVDGHCARGAKCCQDACGLICKKAVLQEESVLPGSLLVSPCIVPDCGSTGGGFLFAQRRKAPTQYECTASKWCRKGYTCCFNGCRNICRAEGQNGSQGGGLFSDSAGGKMDNNMMMMMMSSMGS